MEITKIGSFDENELDTLSSAGSILGAVAKALESGDITTLDDDAKALIAGLQEVLNRLA